MIKRKYLATSNDFLPVIIRKIRKLVNEFSVPVPLKCSHLLLKTVLVVRSVYYFILRVFVFEPLNKAYCKQYGSNFHHGIFLHWIQGKGDIIVGDNVNFSGKLGISFAARFSDCPTLKVGNNTHIGHATSINIQ